MLTRRTFFSWIAGGSAALVGIAASKQEPHRIYHGIAPLAPGERMYGYRMLHQEVRRDVPFAYYNGIPIYPMEGRVWRSGLIGINLAQGPAPSGPGK